MPVLDLILQRLGPAVTLSPFYFAVCTRMTRASLLEIMGMDCLRTARAKGLRRDKVIARHILRNALPIVTVVGMQTAPCPAALWRWRRCSTGPAWAA